MFSRKRMFKYDSGVPNNRSGPIKSRRESDIVRLQRELFGDWNFLKGNGDRPDGSKERVFDREVSPCHTISPSDQQDEVVDQPVIFGIEFEFLVPIQLENPYLRPKVTPERYFVPSEEDSDAPEAWPADYAVENRITEVLRAANIPAVGEQQMSYLGYENETLYQQVISEPYSVWMVKDDMSVQAGLSSPYRNWDFIAVELASRKLPANETGYTEVESVIRLVRQNVLVNISESCGLHVHVDSSVLSLVETKHFICLYLMIEDVLFSFCTPNRYTRLWCLPVTRYSVLADEAFKNNLRTREHEKGKPVPPYARGLSHDTYYQHQLIHAESVHDNMAIDALIMSLSGMTRYCALAIKCHKEGDGENRYTFEFRHLQASFDPEMANQWTRICVALVLSAKGLGEYEGTLANMAYSRFYNIACLQNKGEARRGFLKALDLEDAVEFWQRKVFNYQTPNGWLKDELDPDGFAPIIE